jgi:hypothetical protein
MAVGPTIVIRCFIFILARIATQTLGCRKLVFLDVKSAFKSSFYVLEIQLVEEELQNWSSFTDYLVLKECPQWGQN